MDYLLLIKEWFRQLDITNINEDKLKRQLTVISSWFKFNAIGIFLAVTGFGKSMVAIITIYRLNLKFPHDDIIVIVPDLNLYEDWNNHIETYNLKNVKVYVVNSYAGEYLRTNKKFKCVLLIIDEVHNVLSKEGKVFNKTLEATDYKMFLGLSATLDEEEIAILDDLKIPIVDRVTMDEARRNNYISDYVIYNLGIELDDEGREYYNKINDIHNTNFGKFRYFVEYQKNYELIRACLIANDKKAKIGDDWKTGRQWRQWYAEKNEWDGSEDHYWHPNNIAKYAHQWNWAVDQRKTYLYNHPKKLEVTKEIINTFKIPTITFGQSIASVDKLTQEIGEIARSYHSKIEGQDYFVDVVEIRKSYRSAVMLKQRTQGILEVINVNKVTNKCEYKVTYKKAKRIGSKSIKKLIKEEFESGKALVLNTAKALDEGFNVGGIELAILYAILSVKRNFLQRIGRSLRYIPGKRAKIIVVYFKGTQDESWVKSAQKGEANIYYIDNINQIV